jgi:hypothetical protein
VTDLNGRSSTIRVAGEIGSHRACPVRRLLSYTYEKAHSLLARQTGLPPQPSEAGAVGRGKTNGAARKIAVSGFEWSAIFLTKWGFSTSPCAIRRTSPPSRDGRNPSSPRKGIQRPRAVSAAHHPLMSYSPASTSQVWENGRVRFQNPAPRSPYPAMRASFACMLRPSSNQTSWAIPPGSV